MNAEELTAKAKSLLKHARVAEGRVERTGFVQWESRAHAQEAFALFNTYSGKGPMMLGCAPCHAKVFNWLLRLALAEVPEAQPELLPEA